MAKMGSWSGDKDGAPVRVSPKLDGVYARATKDGVFSKSGKPLDLPRVKARLKRHFRKHPDGVLEGEIWRKGEGVERIAGAVKSGGEAARKLRLHVYPDQGPRPWPIGAVRRVKGETAKGEKGVRKALKKALKKGHEGVVVRRADGTREKLKPREDAEWPVAAVKGGPRNVLVLRHADGGTFRVQGRPGVAAKEGDRVQVRYSGTTAKGRPKAAIAERVRNDNDFSTNIMNTTTRDFVSPARRILGSLHPCARVPRLVELETVEEEIARDRRTLAKIAGGAAALGVTGAMIIRKGRLPVKAAAVPVKVPKGKVPSPALPVKKAGGKMPQPLTPVKGRKKKVTSLEEKRDRLSKVRDGAIIAGTGAVGAGSLVVAGQARKLRKQAGDAMGYAGSSVARAAKEVKREVTPERVAREGLKLVKKKAKQKAVEYFPTFTKAGRLLKKTVLETPARRMGIDLARIPVTPRVLANSRFIGKPKGSAAWVKEVGSVRVADGKTPEEIGKQGDRIWKKVDKQASAKAGEGMKGMSDKDYSRRLGMELRKRHARIIVGDAASDYGRKKLPKPDLDLDFSTPARRMGIEFAAGKRFAKVVKDPETGRTRTVRYGQAGKAADGGDRIRPGTAKGDAYCARSAEIKGDWKSDPNSPNSLSRKKWKCRGKKSMKRGFSAAGFETPAQRMGITFLATREQLRNRDTDVYADPLRVAAGIEKAYRPSAGKAKVAEEMPIGNAQVIRAAINKAEKINKWGTRGGRLVKDAADVVRGKGRERDASGRKKKREWEKSWAQNAAKKAVITAGVLGYATGLKKSPGFRAANVKIAGKVKRKVNEYIPDAFPERRFETPAQRMGITFLARKDRDEAKAGAATGAVAGAVNGTIAGGVAPVLGKEGTEWGKLNARQRAAEAAVREEMSHGGAWKRKKPKGAFGKGKFGSGERLARAENVAASRLKKAVKRGALKGGLAGAAILGTAGYGLGKLAEPKKPETKGKKKAFEAGLARVMEFDEVAESAGWDIRDPRGRSARVFAPGSRRRNRREKRWHERAENERKLWKAAVATAAVGGGAAGLVLSKGLKNGPAGAAAAKLRKLKRP